MEGADWLRTRLTSLHCATCGRSYRDGQIRVRAQRDGLSFVDFVCRACGREANAIVTVVGRGRAPRLRGGGAAGGGDGWVRARVRRRSPPALRRGRPRRWAPRRVNRPVFAHASEVELARILDYYQVAWQYEPRTFPILFNLGGDVVESFSPDFYLPELDLYVELTTLKQSLVRKKNRKLRRLRELYPGIRIKLFYAKDFKALLLKYGRFDLAGSLSGEEGQERPADEQLEDDRVTDVPPPREPGELVPAALPRPRRGERSARRRRAAGAPPAPHP